MSDSVTHEETNQKVTELPDLQDAKWKLTELEKDALGEIGNMCMGASATTLYSLLNRRVSITTPRVSTCNTADQLGSYKKPYLAVEVSYTEGIDGYNIFLLKQEDAFLITDLLMGGDGTAVSKESLGELYLSAISEVMNQMVGASSTSLANILQVPVNISPPKVKEIVMDDDSLENLICHNEVFIKISFSMEIEGLLVSEIMQILPFGFGRELANKLINEEAEKHESSANRENTVAEQEPEPEQYAPSSGSQYSEMPQKNIINEQSKVSVKSVQFQSFEDQQNFESMKTAEPEYTHENIDLIMDVPLHVTVELGRSKKSIQEILGFKMGTVIVLDRLAGEMVDVLVNGKLFARGEVVVIDDSYGVRVTEVIAPKKHYN